MKLTLVLCLLEFLEPISVLIFGGNLKKVLFIFAGLFLVVLLALPVASYIMSVRYYQARREAGLNEFKNFSKDVLADLKLLEEAPLLSTHTFNSNADPLFSQYVSWQGAGMEVLADENHKKMMAFKELHKQWDKSPEGLQEMLKDPMLDSIDVSWLSQVERYDHWSVIENPHIWPELERAQKLDAIARIGVFASLPIPAYNELQTWAAIYFLQMHKKHKAIEGLKVYRKTAELIYGSGFLIPSMIVVKFFNTERFLVQNLKVKNWQTPDKKVTDAFKRVSWAWIGLLKNTFAEEMPAEFKKMVKFENGICSAPFESVMGDAVILDYFGPHFIFETDHRADVERLQSMNEKFQSECHMNALKVFNERTPASINEWRPHREAGYVLDTGINWGTLLDHINISKIPYVRRMFGYFFTNLTEPNYFKMYIPEKN